MFSTFDFFSDSNWKKIGRVSKTTFVQGNSLSKTIFYGFLCLVFFKTLSGNIRTLSSKTFPQIVKKLCTFLWEDRDVYFYKVEIRFFFLVHFFQTSIPVFPESWPFLSGSVNEAAFIFFHRRFSSVERSSSIFFSSFRLFFAILTGKRTDFWPNFFNRLSKRLSYFPEEKCEVYIFSILKEIKSIFFNLLGVWSIFFQKPAKVFSGALSKLSFWVHRKVSPPKVFFWKKIVSFYMFSDVWARKDRSYGHTFWPGLQNCCFPAQMKFNVYFF